MANTAPWSFGRKMSSKAVRNPGIPINDCFKAPIEELAQGLNVARVLPCDVTKEDDLAQLSADLTAMGQLDAVVHSLAFANREDLSRPFLETPRSGFLLAQEVSAYSLV